MSSSSSGRPSFPTRARVSAALWVGLSACGASLAVAQDTLARSYGMEIALRSGHSDRGFLISDRAVLQPVIWAAWKGTEGYLWSNVALADATDGTRPGIVEAELGRQYRWRGFMIVPAARMYFYHEPVSRSRSHSLEAWLTLSRPVGRLTLFTRHSLDLQDNRGGYFGAAGVESSGRLSPSLELGGSFGVGWANATFNRDWAGVAKTAFEQVTAEAWCNLYLRRHLYVGPQLEFSSLVDHDVRAGELFRPSYLLLTLTTGVEF